MLDIRVVGKEILSGKPRKFYIFMGDEYGIKVRYLSTLRDLYGGSVEHDSIVSVISLMKTKSIIPIPRQLHIFRYDPDIMQYSCEDLQKCIDSSDIGTVVGIYNNSSAYKKLNTRFPDLSVDISPVSSMYIRKYLESEYQSMYPNMLDTIVSMSGDYNTCRMLCESAKHLDPMQSESSDLSSLALQPARTCDTFCVQLAAKQISECISSISDYNGEPSDLFYAALRTMLELEKCMCNKHHKSFASRYVNLWRSDSIVYGFNLLYRTLRSLRTSGTVSPTDSLVLTVVDIIGR